VRSELFTGSALPRLEALLGLVDDVNATLATHEAIVTVAITKGFQGVTNFHGFTGN
jgi:hypothetical protein